MNDYCDSNGIQFTSKKLLLSGLKAKKVLLASPLLAWYLSHDCIVTKIYQIIEYTPNRCFKKFVDKVTKYRILGDKHADMNILGACYKLISNSGYGSLLMDKTKHSSTIYTSNIQKVSSLVNSFSFKDLEEFPNEMYEVESYKRNIKVDNPIQIGLFYNMQNFE